jgi:GTP cyclohydrolase II
VSSSTCPTRRAAASASSARSRPTPLQDQGLDTVDANLEQGQPIDARDYAFAGEILKDLGLTRIRLMTNNPDKIEALISAGIEVTERIPLVVEASPHNKAYLETKRKRLAHEL